MNNNNNNMNFQHFDNLINFQTFNPFMNYNERPRGQNTFLRIHTNNYYDCNILKNIMQYSGDHQMNPEHYPFLNYYVEQCGNQYIIAKIARINYYKRRVNERNMTRARFYLFNIKICNMTDNNIITRALNRISVRRGHTYETITENIFNNIENINEPPEDNPVEPIEEETSMEDVEDMFE